MATALWLEFGQDFALNSNGGLLMAQQFDATRQALERIAMTVPAGAQYPNGALTTPDFIADPGFGLGLQLQIGNNLTGQGQHAITQALVAAAAGLPGVDPSQPASVTIIDNGNHTFACNVIVYLLSGVSIPLQLAIGGQ